jgi:lipopolysaccharide/colanic/teichoic acid biosynthesis glycosyltransferase
VWVRQIFCTSNPTRDCSQKKRGGLDTYVEEAKTSRIKALRFSKMFKINGAYVLNGRLAQFGVGLAKKRAKIRIGFVYWMKEYLLSPILLAVFSLALVVIREKKQKVGFSPSISKMARLKVKRIIDVLIAAVCLALFAPFFVIIGVLIWLDSPGPIIYKQVRVGQNRRRVDRRKLNFQFEADRRNGDRRKYNVLGRPFHIYKFRTMVNGAEKGTGPVWAKQGDPRITRVGRLLRKRRLDEFPQLFNVLVGDMSLVGPRPERPHFIKRFSTHIENYKQRFWLRPGITGLAQVSAGYDSSVACLRNKTKYDLKYIKHWHITEDLIIILRTIAIMTNGKGAA